MANFADDTTFMAVGDKPEDAATSLQTTVNLGKLYWFLRRNSSGSMYNKLLLYHQVVKRVGSTKSNSGDVQEINNLDIIQ